MKKIESRQMPRAKIMRPLLVGGLLLFAASAGAEAQGCVSGAQKAQPGSSKSSKGSGGSSGQSVGDKYKQYNTPSSGAQRVISGSSGCVLGAVPYSGASGAKKTGTSNTKSPPKKKK